MFKLRVTALATLVLLASPLLANADQVVSSQPATSPVTDISFDSAGFTTFQIFTVTQGATVTSISFEGAWVQDAGNPESDYAERNCVLRSPGLCTERVGLH